MSNVYVTAGGHVVSLPWDPYRTVVVPFGDGIAFVAVNPDGSVTANIRS